MKRLLIIALLLSANISIAEEIKLDLSGETVERAINLTPVNEPNLDSANQPTSNKGVILQNSVTPINGLQYNSTRMPMRVDEPSGPMMITPMLNR